MAEEKIAPQKKSVDWELIESGYRANVKTVRQLAKEYGVSHTAIQKRAEKFGWTRDLSEKILQTTQSMVATQVVARSVATETKLTDAAVVKAYSEASASIDMLQRDDLSVALGVSRSQMMELSALSDPKFAKSLEWLGELMDTSGEDANGKMVLDKANELYRYIISLPGRVKMSKEIAGAHGVYIPLQRKVFNLDGEKNQNAASFEEMLKSVGKLDT